MPEPQRFVFGQGNNEDAETFVRNLITSEIRQSKAIDKGRAGLFGNGLIKSLATNEPGAQKRAEKVMDFFQAVASNDSYRAGKLAAENAVEYKSALNDGRITDIEYNTLAPANEGTSADGGYAVPIEWAADLSRNLGMYGYARRHLRNIGMKSNLLNIPGLLTKPTVAVTAEKTAIAASKPAMDNLQLTAKKIAGLYSASNEYLADTNLDNYAIILDIFTEQIQIAEDTGAFQNANTNWPGLLWYGAGTITSGVAANGARAVSRTNLSTGGATKYPQFTDTAAVTDSYADMLTMLANQPSALFQGGKFFVDQSTLMAILNIRDSQNRVLANLSGSWEVKTGLDGQPILYFSGYECVVIPNGIMYTWDTSAHVSTPFMVFCNPTRAYAMMGTRGGFIVDTLREGTVDGVSAAESDLTLIRMTERIAFGVGRPNTITVLRTDAS